MIPLTRSRVHQRLRPLRASLRDTFVLLREFRWGLIVLALAVVIGAAIWQRLVQFAGLPVPSFAEAAFDMLAMIFLQANLDFPDVWYLQLFFFVMPVIGLAGLARGAADFGVLLFNRQARGEAWQVAVASTYSDHIVLVGLGHLGFRVARELHGLGQDVVAIEIDPKADLVEGVRALGFPIIHDNALKAETLGKAGIERAHAVILCTSDDALNLQMALKARALNSKARVIVRLFDDDFAREVSHHFGIDLAYSASSLAAPVFASAATQDHFSRPIALAGRVLSLSRFSLPAHSPFNGQSVREFEHRWDVSIVLHQRGEAVDLHPDPDVRLAAGDAIAVLAEPHVLSRIVRDNGKR